jgi:hypothetical protein
MSSTNWDGLNVTHNLRQYLNAPNVFHSVRSLGVNGSLSVVIFLLNSVGPTDLLLEHKTQFKLPAVEVYDVIDATTLLCVGYLFRSPLGMRHDPYFVSFHRPWVNPVTDIIKAPIPAQKRFVINERIVLFTHGAGITLSLLEENSVTSMLGSP